MRSNAMKSCAVGAMLFGGTLGVNSVASADAVFTWLPGFGASSANSSLQTSPDSGSVEFAPIASNIGSRTLTDGGASARFVNSALGFSIGGSGMATYVSASRFLTISGLGVGETVTASFSLSLTGTAISGAIQTWDPNLFGGAWNPTIYFTSVSSTVQLSNGTYAVSLGAGDDLSSATWSLGSGGTLRRSLCPLPARSRCSAPPASWAAVVAATDGGTATHLPAAHARTGVFQPLGVRSPGGFAVWPVSTRGCTRGCTSERAPSKAALVGRIKQRPRRSWSAGAGGLCVDWDRRCSATSNFSGYGAFGRDRPRRRPRSRQGRGRQHRRRWRFLRSTSRCRCRSTA